MRRTANRVVQSTMLLALASASGCCLDYWGEVEEQASVTDLRLDDLVEAGFEPGDTVAFGAGGLIIRDGKTIDLELTVELHAIATERWDKEIVALVGDGGTIVLWVHAAFGTGVSTWKVFQAPVDDPLVGVGLREGLVIAVGDEVVVSLETQTYTSSVVEAPEGGWGSLNTVVNLSDGRVLLAGDAGALWVLPAESESPFADAYRVELDVEDDILAGGVHFDFGPHWLVGSNGLALYETAPDLWQPVHVGTSADFVDFAAGAALTNDGELWDPWRAKRIVELPWARGIAEGPRNYDRHDGDWYEDPEVLIVGDDGRHAILDGC